MFSLLFCWGHCYDATCYIFLTIPVYVPLLKFYVYLEYFLVCNDIFDMSYGKLIESLSCRIYKNFKYIRKLAIYRNQLTESVKILNEVFEIPIDFFNIIYDNQCHYRFLFHADVYWNIFERSKFEKFEPVYLYVDLAVRVYISLFDVDLYVF